MLVNVLPQLFLSFFYAIGSHAQEVSGTLLENTERGSIGQSAPTATQTLSPKSAAIEEEHPRLFWIIPTYTVTNSKQHIPLTARGKWRLYEQNETDPFTYVWVAFEAGLAQANNDLPGYGQGASGYGKRFGAGFADQATGGFFGTFFFSTILHQDPRYYRLGSGSFKNRLGHALIRPVLTHTDEGRRAFNLAGILGSIARSTLSNAYYPEGDRGVGPTFSRVGMSFPSSMIDELIDEFGPDLQNKIFGKH